MSSETSTESVRPKPADRDSTLEPWQFFVLAALGCATAALFASRGQGVTAIVLLTVLMGATALVGIAALRTLRPLVSAEEERTVMVGHRTRVALEREKMLALRAIKELEFDRAMGKLSDADWNEMSGRLRSRATRLMRQLDAGEGYRAQIERELAKRMAGGSPDPKGPAYVRHESHARRESAGQESYAGHASLSVQSADQLGEWPHPGGPANGRADESISARRTDPLNPAGRRPDPLGPAIANRMCVSCDTENDADAKFCKACGQKL
jgi:hypothetical protein